MTLLRRIRIEDPPSGLEPGAPAGMLGSQRRAQPALLRMLSRARRQPAPLLLVRVAPGAGPAEAHQRFLAGLAAELRIGDLAWTEAGGVVVLLLEDLGGERRPAEALLERLRQRARREGAQPEWRTAHFPEQGLTLAALLEEVQWRR